MGYVLTDKNNNPDVGVDVSRIISTKQGLSVMAIIGIIIMDTGIHIIGDIPGTIIISHMLTAFTR